MTDHRLDQILGTTGRDPGCEAGLDFIDEYCDIVASGDMVPDRFADFVTHLGNCRACREDTEGLLAVVREQQDRSRR
ncbi:MAG TPA: hypothetical protein VIK41_25465 [Gemmatimonadaceae bacterium]|jgi:hypothetical protein